MENEKYQLPEEIYQIVEEMVILGSIFSRDDVDTHSIKLALRNYKSAKERTSDINQDRFDRIVKNQLKHYGYNLKNLEVKL